MDRTVTVSVKGLLVAALVLPALVVAYLLGGAGAPPGAVAAPQPGDAAGEDVRTLRMTGRGEAAAVPDRMGFTLTASAKRDDLGDALAAASAATDRALDRLRGHGVRRADVRTTGLRMHPEYDYPSSGPRVLTGYRVTQTARVTVRDLAVGGEAIADVVRSGDAVVGVGGIRLEVGDTAEVLEAARDDAVRVATAKAEQYAAATGQALAEVLTVREVTARAPGPQSLGSYAARDARAGLAVPIRAGERESAVTVEIVWSLS